MDDMEQVRQEEFNRLLAKKSSFQAWKCVSFGYALLALVLLSSKLHEVSTDLRLLMSIDQILLRAPGNETSQHAGRGNLSATNWPPMPLEVMLAATEPNETSPVDLDNDDQQQAAANNSATQTGSLLVGHMHNSIGRELTGNQLLRQEVESFLG